MSKTKQAPADQDRMKTLDDLTLEECINQFVTITLCDGTQVQITVIPVKQQHLEVGDLLLAQFWLRLPTDIQSPYVAAHLTFSGRLRVCGDELRCGWGVPDVGHRKNYRTGSASTWMAAMEGVFAEGVDQVRLLDDALRARREAWNSEGLEYLLQNQLIEEATAQKG